MHLIAEKSRGCNLSSDFWTECPEVKRRKLNMERLTFGHCVQKQKEFCNVFFVGVRKYPIPPIVKLKVSDIC